MGLGVGLKTHIPLIVEKFLRIAAGPKEPMTNNRKRGQSLSWILQPTIREEGKMNWISLYKP
jgi:hypothetical protein